MRGMVFVAMLLAASAASAGELFQGSGWGPHSPATGQVHFGDESHWVLTGGELVDGGWLRSFDLYGYAARIDIGVSDGKGGSILLESVVPSGTTDKEGWTHYEVGADLLSTNGGYPYSSFGGHSGGPRYSLHNGYFTKTAGHDIPNSPSNAVFMPDGLNAGGIVAMRTVWETLDPPYGDANHDGRIDLNDFGLVKSRFEFGTSAAFEGGDLTGNAYVSLNDFGLLKQNFGWRAPAANTPEPSATILACAALVVLLSAHGIKTRWQPRRISAARPRFSLPPR